MFERARALLPSNLSDVPRECALSGGATRLRSCAFVVGIVALLGSPIRADSDVFMRMVGVALTGSDTADIKVIGDRANCVFAVKNELFRLNNVYTDRINLRTFEPEAGNPRTWMTLTLHGDEIVFEETIEPPKDDGSETMRRMRAEYPDSFSTHHYRYTEYELHLTTDDKNEVKRAWQYVYGHGCTGKQSPS
jgi:hypothetical protein